jgi:AcrR family transcriptional regulator
MPSTNTSKRGDQTRDQLIAAAIEIFGRDGFHAASTRAIAQRAGANQALIGYHFGGKQGLYLAVFEGITEGLRTRMLPVVTSATQQLTSIEKGCERATAISALELVFDTFAGVLAQEATSGWVRMIMREQQDPTAAFEIIYDGIMGPMLQLLSRLISLATGRAPDDADTRLQGLMLLGQVLVFVIARTTTARHTGWEKLGQPQLDAIRKQLHLNIRAQFAEASGT